MYQRLSLNEAEAFFYDNDYLLVVGLSGDKDLVINAKDLPAKAASQIASNFVSIQQADDTEIGFLFSLSSDAADDSSSCSSLSQASSTTTLDDSGPGWAKIQTNTILQSLYQHQINGIFLVQLTAKDVFVLIRFPVFSIAAQKAVKDALSPKTKTGKR